MYLAAACPALTAANISSRPLTMIEAKNPPTKASPAPFVSTILVGSNTSTMGYSVTVPLPTATMVDLLPCVKMTVRGRDGFFLGRLAMCNATCCKSIVPSALLIKFKSNFLAYVSASLSFPNKKSAYSMAVLNGSVKKSIMKGADKFKANNLSLFNVCSATWTKLSTLTVKKNPAQ